MPPPENIEIWKLWNAISSIRGNKLSRKHVWKLCLHSHPLWDKCKKATFLGTGQTILLTTPEGCICTRKCPVASLIFHPFVSFLFLRTLSSREKRTRSIRRPARQAAETMIRSISCSLQLRQTSKNYGDKTLKWAFGYFCFFKRGWFSFKKMQLSFKLIYQDWYNQLFNTNNFILLLNFKESLIT